MFLNSVSGGVQGWSWGLIEIHLYMYVNMLGHVTLIGKKIIVSCYSD